MALLATNAQLLQPTPLHGQPFGTGLHRRRAPSVPTREVPPLEPSSRCAPVGSPPKGQSVVLPLAGPSREVTHHLTWGACSRSGVQLFDALTQACKALRGASSSTVPCEGEEQVLSFTLSEAHAAIVAVDEELPSAQDMQAHQRSPEEEELVKGCRVWLHQLQTFLFALKSDVDSAREAMASGTQDAVPAWQRLLQAASSKLHMASARTLSSEGDPREPEAALPLDSADSSCNSSVCGSSSCHSSAELSSKAGSRQSGHRLVATRARLQYNKYWAHKVAI